jgi:hypothetical protein
VHDLPRGAGSARSVSSNPSLRVDDLEEYHIKNGRKGEAPHLKRARIVVIDTAAPLARPFLPRRL